MKKRRLNRKLINTIDFLLTIICLILIIFSGYKIFNWRMNNVKNKKINETLHEYITVQGNDKYNINFDKLKEKNKDTVAYLKVEGTNIDYVVVQGNDNEYYLNHNFNKDNNKSGWIFADYNNKFDNTDKNIIIYGHNTIDKSMFGSLKNILDSSWYKNEKNHKVILVTENGLELYDVFSTYKVDNEEYYIRTTYKDDNDYEQFLNTIKRRSNYNYSVELNKDDQILTLSTCANGGDKRVVLHAKKEVKEIVENE